jgi:hypothetical protein
VKGNIDSFEIIKMSFGMTSDRMKLRVCAVKTGICEVIVNPTGPVSVLATLFPGKCPTFIHRGQILCGSMSFEFYGIKDGEAIIAMLGTETTFDLPRWSSITQDAAFNDKVALLLDSGMKRSTARLRDVAFLKFQNRPRQFRRWCFNALSQSGAPSHVCAGRGQTIVGHADCPCIEPLPVSWSEDDEASDQTVTVATDKVSVLEKTSLMSSSPECATSF